MNILDYLRSKGYRIEKRGSVYQMICPFKEKHIDYKPSFTIYEETNSFYCFGCHTGGALIHLMKLLGDPIPKELIDVTNTVQIQEINKKTCRQKRILNAIIRIRRLRSIYKDQHKLNKRLLKLIGGIDDNSSYG